MDMYPKYTSPFGYQTGVGGIDTYGVNHNNFSLRDEIEYQFARQKRENQLMQQYNNQGITENYPQYGTNFWGNAANNYGFGMTNIAGNIANMQNNTTPIPMTATPQSSSIIQTTLQPNNNLPSGMQQSGVFNSIKSTVNNMWQNIKDGATIAADTIKYTPESLGELAADTKIAYDYWQKMNQTGDKLVKTFGSGQGADIDNYYHPLLQCELAKISPTSRDWGLRLGYAKEILDYHKKKGTMPMSVISADSQKDLQNNLYGSNLGYYNPNTSCEDLLDDRRTPNMRKANIR